MHTYTHLGEQMREALKTLGTLLWTGESGGAVSQEIYHVLGVAVVVGTARVSVAVILAVDHSALDSFLNLMQRGETSFKALTQEDQEKNK